MTRSLPPHFKISGSLVIVQPSLMSALQTQSWYLSREGIVQIQSGADTTHSRLVTSLFVAAFHVLVLPLLGGVLDRSHDLVVAGATTEVAGKVKADFVFGRLRVLCEQSFARHDEARRANTALQRGSFEKRFLNWIEALAGGNSFNSLNAGSFRFDCENQATIDRSTVNQDRASSAVAVRATFLCTRQVERVPQDFEQRLTWLAKEFCLTAVKSCGDDTFFCHIHFPANRMN